MITDVSQNEIFDAFNKIIPYLKEFFDEDVIFGINNTEYALKVVSNKNIPVNAKEGDRIAVGSAGYESLKKGKTVSKLVSKEVYGVPLRSTAVPVRDKHNKIIGNIIVGRSRKKQQEIADSSATLSNALKQMTSAISKISEGMQNAGNASEKIVHNLKNTEAKTEETDQVIEFIRNVSSKTNLLGLNAAIESSRAGDAGKGFGVVAQEIRKLSSSSSESIKKIEKVINEIQGSVSEITKEVNELNGVFQEQAAAIQQLNASIQQLNSSAEIMEKISSEF